MDGVLVIDKPAGPTSFEVVQRVRSLLGVKKAGHTGTLDPLATGVLPICVGEGTKLAGFILQSDKGYDALIRLGSETDTQDAAGKVLRETAVPVLSSPRIEDALARFRGSFLQTPPMFSAVKVGGKRLYELARAGKEVERAPRQVTVYALTLIDFSATELRLRVRCSKGFFVRTLAVEIGHALGCAAHLGGLRRTSTGPFGLPQALSPTALETLWQNGSSEGIRAVESRLISPLDALAELPVLSVSEADGKRVSHGLPIEARDVSGRVRVVSGGSRLLAVAEVGADGRLEYLRVFA